MVRRYFVVLILLYVALDLSVPAVPGAFVFNAAESVETVQRNRSQDVTAAVSEPAIGRDLSDAATAHLTRPPKPSRETHRLTPMPMRTTPARHAATPDLAPASEDPH